ncbi:hypothetical protein B0H19DRAFT_1249484 [Mycena capillaripes]|nr:hypothetical protein B0H19DRAFT_1249484 [Mycena capillaripes]
MLLLPLFMALALPAAAHTAFPRRDASPNYVHEDAHSNLEPSQLALFSDGSAQTRLSWSGTSRSEFDGVPSPPLEVLPLGISGPSSNRVDLVSRMVVRVLLKFIVIIFNQLAGLLEEREKFIKDATRLADDISNNQTFNTVKAFDEFLGSFHTQQRADYNFLRVVQSGLGVEGKPKDTAFGLYRDGTELRAVYYAKPKTHQVLLLTILKEMIHYTEVWEDSSRKSHISHLPNVLNLRSRVITPSIANGALILRHELGHSIIKVGEEYDGFGYFGPNAHANLSLETLPWNQWLTDPKNFRVERSVMPMQDYAWALLNTMTPWSVTFTSSGTFARHLVHFSVSGLPSAADLKVELDGVDLGWAPHPNIGLDRWYYDVYRAGGLSGGLHTLTFTLLNSEREPAAQMCSAEVLEFGDESEFVSTPGHHSLYPTYDINNKTTYRPTNEDCLMRRCQLTTPNFCKACLEGLWLNLLRDVTLIDALNESCPLQADGTVSTLNLRLVPLAQFRTAVVEGLDESYTITWSKDGAVLPGLTNKTQVDVAPGTYAVDVKYSTSEVRVDPNNVLSTHMDYTVSENCVRTRPMMH